MIVWGSGSSNADLGVVAHRHCETCGRDRPFSLLLQYRYAHVYWLRWVTGKTYHLACGVCRRGWEVKAKYVEPRLKENAIPFMTRYGWAFLLGLIVLVPVLAGVSGR